MENFNIKIVFDESEETTKRLLALITEEEPDMKEPLSQVTILADSYSKAPRLYVNDLARLSACTDLQLMGKTLLRDFLITMPRIAAIRTISMTDTNAEGIRLFGPYTQEMLFDQQRQFSSFDIIITESDQQASSLLEEMSEEPVCALLMDEDEVIVEASVYNDNDEANAHAIRQAVYLALDVARCRRSYDYARRHPLQKLYHERPDGGEKLRFKPFAPIDKKDGQETTGNKAAL